MVYLAKDNDFEKITKLWTYKGSETEIEIPEYINGELVTITRSMFRQGGKYNASPVTKVVLKHSNVIYMNYMFNGCSNLTTLDLSGLNTTNVTSMQSMFQDCRSLTSLDLSGLNTTNVTNMGGMFNDCGSLTSLDLSSFDTSKVTDMKYMFRDCSSLTSLDLSSFDTSKVTDMHHMFRNCGSLKEIHARTKEDAEKLKAQTDTDLSLIHI